MKLWLLKQDDNRGYNTYDACVVAAIDENDAVNIRPDGKSWRSRKLATYEKAMWAKSPKSVSVTLLGTAESGTPRGVILSSYRAG